MSRSIMKSSFFEKFQIFLREMIVLLYRFTKVAGLTCNLDKTLINCFPKFSFEFVVIFRIIFGKPVNNCFLTDHKKPFGGVLKNPVQNLLRKFLVKPNFS